jgi:hypothetical protein
MPLCKLCQKEREPDEIDDDGYCDACRNAHGFSEPGPSLRPLIPCTRCSGRSFVRCLSIRERAATGGDHSSAYIAPLAATFDHDVYESLFKKRKVTTPNVHQPVGIFEAYICRGCGYVELYARKPGEIPIGTDHNTELIEVQDEPYR